MWRLPIGDNRALFLCGTVFRKLVIDCGMNEDLHNPKTVQAEKETKRSQSGPLPAEAPFSRGLKTVGEEGLGGENFPKIFARRTPEPSLGGRARHSVRAGRRRLQWRRARHDAPYRKVRGAGQFCSMLSERARTVLRRKNYFLLEAIDVRGDSEEELFIAGLPLTLKLMPEEPSVDGAMT